MQRLRSRVEGPLGRPGGCGLGVRPGHRDGLSGCAQACGLTLLGGPPSVSTALAAQSAGVGELIGAAIDRGAATVVVGLGGSACTDGGRGWWVRSGVRARLS